MRFLIALVCIMGGTLFAQTTQPTSQPTTAPSTQPTSRPMKNKAASKAQKDMSHGVKNDEMNKQKMDKYGIAMSQKNMLGGLQVGDQAPNFSGIDQNGEKVALQELLKEGEVVVIFYRGYWCGICNRHLSEMEQKLSSITNKGAQVIAVTTESNEFVKKTADKNELSFSVISDENNSILSDYKVLYEVSESYQEKIHNYTDSTIKEFNDSDDAILPIPATYIIDQQGNISWMDYNMNYAKRASVEDISNALK